MLCRIFFHFKWTWHLSKVPTLVHEYFAVLSSTIITSTTLLARSKFNVTMLRFDSYSLLTPQNRHLWLSLAAPWTWLYQTTSVFIWCLCSSCFWCIVPKHTGLNAVAGHWVLISSFQGLTRSWRTIILIRSFFAFCVLSSRILSKWRWFQWCSAT